MLDENAIVQAVCIHLQREGWEITKRCTTSQQGIDVIAERAGKRWLVEA
ncbi:MAG: hypothetical protein AB7H66_13380 [Hyphomonadaceae bacterium]